MTEVDYWPTCQACGGSGLAAYPHGAGTCCQCLGTGKVNPALKNKTLIQLMYNPIHEWNKNED